MRRCCPEDLSQTDRSGCSNCGRNGRSQINLRGLTDAPRCGGPPTSSGDGIRGSIAWSGAFRVASQGSALVAVPILLHALGTDVYAVWVLASSLVFAQGLIDFGFSAVLIRFVAIGATARSQAFVRVVLLRVGAVYALLSLLGAVLWILAGPFARSLPYLEGPQIDEAVSLFRYMAVAFALTNASMVANAALQGLNRIAVAFQAQTIGALGFVPALVVGLMFLPAVHAVGAAAIASYGLPLVLLAPALWKAMRQLPRNAADPPTLRMMLNVGARWQVSNWADFATYQLPRLVSGILLSSGAVLIIDLALRIGQAVATPLFALLPLVLPRASAASIHNGREGLRQFLRPLLQKGLPFFCWALRSPCPLRGQQSRSGAAIPCPYATRSQPVVWSPAYSLMHQPVCCRQHCLRSASCRRSCATRCFSSRSLSL